MSVHDDILDAKLALEYELAEPLSAALSAYISTWERGQGVVRTMDHVAHKEQIESVLLRHYARVVAVMSGRVPGGGETIDSVALGPAHAASLRSRAHNQTLHMLRGMDRDLMTALAAIPVPSVPLVKSASMNGGIEIKKDIFSVQMLARFKETAKQAWHKLKARMRAIANLETEAAAEEYQIEWVKQKYANARIYKTWNSLMDGRERPTHHEAHGQEVLVDQPFIVGGAMLKQPGDTSLGAPLSETINCRCFSSFSLVGPNGERIDIPLQTPALPAKRRWRPGDKFGVETPVRPTESVTLNGTTRARVVLGDGRTFATMQQVDPGTIVVTVNGQAIARAAFSGPSVTSMTLADGADQLGIGDLIRRSVRGTHEFLMRRR